MVFGASQRNNDVRGLGKRCFGCSRALKILLVCRRKKEKQRAGILGLYIEIRVAVFESV